MPRRLPPSSVLKKLCRARDLIRDCYGEPLTLPELSAEAGLSAWHFLRLFKAAFGETPHQFHTRLRIEKAQELLTVTGRSVTDVCLDVGYSSLGSFSTLFARHVGESPHAFRRRVRAWVRVPGRHPWALVPYCFALAFGPRDESMK
jgi:AraC-like DNA-binding protein